MKRTTVSERSLVLAPIGRDAELATHLLVEAGIDASPCADLGALLQELDRGAAFVVLTEEAVATADIGPLAAWLDDQQQWSDLPFILLTRHGGGPERNPAALRYLDVLGNVTFLERPFHPTTLISMARAALRGRKRQYETRGLIGRLSESEDHYRNAVELNPQVAWTAGPDGQLDHVAQRWLEWTGTTGLGETWAYGLHQDDRARTFEVWARSVASGEPYDIEHRVKMIDGRYRWAHSRAYARRDGKGAIVKWYGSTEDIEERKAAEDHLAASEARFRSLADAMPQLVWTADADGRVDYYNARRKSYAGTDALDWAPFVHPEDLERTVAAWREATATGRSYACEHRLKTTEGEWVWHMSRAECVRDADGHVAKWYGTATDIAALKQAQETANALNRTLEARVVERTAERNLLATIVETTDAMIQALDLDHRFLAINRSCAQQYQRVHGVTPKVGDRLPDLLAHRPRAREEALAVWQRALAGEDFLSTETLGGADGERRVYDLSFEVLRDGEGRAFGAFMTGRDVTEQRARDDALAKAQAQLFETQKVETIGQLTGGVAHDFNNLLAAILSNLDLARKRIEDERLLKLIDGAIKGAERGDALTKRLLAFARRQELRAEAVSLAALFDGMRELLERSLGPSVGIASAFPDDLPKLLVDPNQLELAILNIAVNARDAMPQGGTLRIEARAETIEEGGSPDDLRPGAYVRLRLSDSGAGMDAATLKRATEPFFTTKGVGKGTGLGLSMVHGLASQSGGALRIESEAGQGTTIEIWLPQAEAARAAERTVAPLAAPAAVAGALTVLVVDDDVLVGMGTAAMLEDLGHAVVEASSGRAALELLDDRSDIDLVVTDYAMPGMTGMELARNIKQRWPRLPIVLATGYAELSGREEAGLPRLAKPFRQEDLVAVLDNLAMARAS